MLTMAAAEQQRMLMLGMEAPLTADQLKQRIAILRFDFCTQFAP
jgi:hypothetical protein